MRFASSTRRRTSLSISSFLFSNSSSTRLATSSSTRRAVSSSISFSSISCWRLEQCVRREREIEGGDRRATGTVWTSGLMDCDTRTRWTSDLWLRCTSHLWSEQGWPQMVPDQYQTQERRPTHCQNNGELQVFKLTVSCLDVVDCLSINSQPHSFLHRLTELSNQPCACMLTPLGSALYVDLETTFLILSLSPPFYTVLEQPTVHSSVHFQARVQNPEL